MALPSDHVYNGALPVLGEIRSDVWEAIAGGQPVLLTRGGTPVAVVVDLDSFAEIETITGLDATSPEGFADANDVLGRQ